MAKKKATQVRKPSSPRSLSDWERGNWAKASPDKVKYDYCKKGMESLRSIAKKLAGKKTGDPKHPRYLKALSWRSIAQLNFGTDNPDEINYYLEHFNGCGTRVTSDRKNYVLDAKDDRPWLWIPTQKPTPIKVKTKSKSKIKIPPPISPLTRDIRSRFGDIDTDKDGFLDKDEIDTALGDHTFKGNEAAMVATVKKMLGDFEELADDEIGWENDGITKADIAAFEKAAKAKLKPDTTAKIEDLYNWGISKIAGTKRQLFVGKKVDPTNVSQGMIGDCWYLAALVGVAFRNEADVRAMITPKGGSLPKYEVGLPGGKKVTITEPTDGELVLFASSGGNGLWLSLIEKAYGQANNDDAYIWVDTSVTDAADGGDRISKGIELMTGSSVNVDLLLFTSIDTTRDRLEKAFKSNKIVTAAVNQTLLQGQYSDDGLVRAHAYTVVSYNRKRDVIRVRNPWGIVTDRKTGFDTTRITPVAGQPGTFEMKLEDFDETFGEIAYEE